jgi:hypothetical protein
MKVIYLASENKSHIRIVTSDNLITPNFHHHRNNRRVRKLWLDKSFEGYGINLLGDPQSL